MLKMYDMDKLIDFCEWVFYDIASNYFTDVEDADNAEKVLNLLRLIRTLKKSIIKFTKLHKK